MGTFSYTDSITYDTGDGSGSGGGGNPIPQSPSVQNPVPDVPTPITDGEGDDTFEIGDSITVGGFLQNYEGTVIVDGVAWPAFRYDVSTGYSDFVTVYMDQVPVSVPPTYSPNAGATFNDACFAPGTLIATTTGADRVEDLVIGDKILTADGRSVAVKWIGLTSAVLAVTGAKAQPVRIRANAFDGGLPNADLTVTADHGMVLDGLVINAGALVNGTTIDYVPLSDLPDRVTYYHIETEDHDAILANGTPAETFVDVAGRAGFDNYAEYLDLYDVERIIPEMRAPRITTQRLLPNAIKVRLGIDDKAADFGKVSVA